VDEVQGVAPLTGDAVVDGPLVVAGDEDPVARDDGTAATSTGTRVAGRVVDIGHGVAVGVHGPVDEGVVGGVAGLEDLADDGALGPIGRDLGRDGLDVVEGRDEADPAAEREGDIAFPDSWCARLARSPSVGARLGNTLGRRSAQWEASTSWIS
jgi:hypothetical protein